MFALPEGSDETGSVAEMQDEFVCLHGHPITPAGLFKIRDLKRQVAQSNELTRAEQLLVDAVVYEMVGPRLRARVEGLGGKVAAALVQALEGSTKTGEDPRMEEVRKLIADKKLMTAIKRYREIHGCGLFEAKAACESLAQRG